MKNWFEDDAFCESLFPLMFSEEKFEVAQEDVIKLQTLIRSPFKFKLLWTRPTCDCVGETRRTGYLC